MGYACNTTTILTAVATAYRFSVILLNRCTYLHVYFSWRQIVSIPMKRSKPHKERDTSGKPGNNQPRQFYRGNRTELKRTMEEISLLFTKRERQRERDGGGGRERNFNLQNFYIACSNEIIFAIYFNLTSTSPKARSRTFK